MNRVIIIGRLVRDAEVRWTQGPEQKANARFTLAVDRRVARNNGENTADFIACAAFGKRAEFLEKYGKKGTKFVVEGRLQTGSYTNREGQKVYTTDVIVENIEFAESKGEQKDGFDYADSQPDIPVSDGFMSIPDTTGTELPFA